MVRFFVVLVLVLFASIAQAEIIQFDMTGLTGSSADSLKVDSLVYHGPTGVVNSVSFRVTGVVNDLGEICCGGPEFCPGDTYPWFLSWWGSIEKTDDPDPVHGKWVAVGPGYLDHIFSFDQTGVAENQNAFQSLSEGDVFDVELYFGPGAWMGECDLIRPPDGTMFTVTILMDVSYPLPTRTATWGQVKSLFN